MTKRDNLLLMGRNSRIKPLGVLMMDCFWWYLLGYTDVLSGHLSTVVPPDVLLLPPASLNVD